MLTAENLKILMLRRAETFVKGGVLASIQRDRHMNDFGENPETFDEGIVLEMLRKLIKVTSFPSTMALDALNALKAGADKIRLHTDAPLKQTTIDAILVAFVNYVGLCCCVDYGLYTKDLSSSGQEVLRGA